MTANNYVGVLEKTLLMPNGRDFYVEWVGKTTFGYDANGTIKWESSLKDNTLYANFQWNEGYATDCMVDFLAPDGTYLKNYTEYTADLTTGGSGGYSIEDSMLWDMWLDGINNVIHFKVREKYDASKENNTFIMRVYTVSTNQTYDVLCEIKFIKDGDQGTQGSDWMAPIWPTNHRTIDGVSKWKYPLDYPAPLVVDAASLIQIPNDVGEVGKYRLFMRPFVTKNGERLEDMNPTEGYTYKVYWDVRYPLNSVMPGVAGASFLRLYDTGGAPLTVNTGTPGTTNPPAMVGY